MATRKGEKDEDVLVGVLLSLLGRDGVKIYKTFVFADAADAKKINPVLDEFSDYFEPIKCEVFDRFRFHKRHQQQGESFDTWLVDLMSLVKSCNYGTDAGIKSVLRDQIVLGVVGDIVREKLLYDHMLTFASACAIVPACESSSSQLSQIAVRSDAVHAPQEKTPRDRSCWNYIFNNAATRGQHGECWNYIVNHAATRGQHGGTRPHKASLLKYLPPDSPLL